MKALRTIIKHSRQLQVGQRSEKKLEPIRRLPQSLINPARYCNIGMGHAPPTRIIVLCMSRVPPYPS